MGRVRLNSFRSFQVLLQDALAHLVGADVLVLQAQTVLLVFLGYLLGHLAFLHSGQFGELVVLAALRAIGVELHGPDVVFAGLAGRQPYLLAAGLGSHRAHLHVAPEDGAHGGKERGGINALLRHPLLVEVEIEFLVVVFPPRELRADVYLLDAPVAQQLCFQPLGPLIQFVVVVAVHHHPV